jgi:hypothetical protein
MTSAGIVISVVPASASAKLRLADRAAIALLGVVSVIALLTFADYGLGWDDYTHSQYGALLLRLYESGFHDRSALSFVNLYAYGGGFDMFAALLAKILPFDLFETRRLAGAVVGLLGLVATWRLGRRVGGPLAGLLALALLAVCPLYYGHMYMNAKDAPFAAAMVFCLLGLVRAFEEYPALTPASGAIVGAGFGLAIGTRILGGFAVVYALAALVWIVAIEARRIGVRTAGARAGAFVLAMLPALVLAYAVMALVWPWSVVDPSNPLKALVYFSHFFEKPWRELFDGAFILVPDMPRRYVPQFFAIKLPEVLLLLGLAGAIGAFAASLAGSLAPQRRAVLLMLALAATLPIAVAFATRPAMYNGIRHFVFVTPAIAVLAGLAAARSIEWLAAWRPAAGVAGLALVAAGAVQPVVEMTKLHPYEYTYFNALAGGVRTADPRYMIDYWGLSFKQAGAALRTALAERHETPVGRSQWKVAVCGPHPAAVVALGPQFDVGWEPRGADFALMLAEYYCLDLPAPVLVEIKRDGVVYARVYDIRRRSITNLLTVVKP